MGEVFDSKVFRLNNNLQTFCREQCVQIFGMWNSFCNSIGMALSHGIGLHLSWWEGGGAAMFDRLPSKALRRFLAKSDVGS